MQVLPVYTTAPTWNKIQYQKYDYIRQSHCGSGIFFTTHAVVTHLGPSTAVLWRDNTQSNEIHIRIIIQVAQIYWHSHSNDNFIITEVIPEVMSTQNVGGNKSNIMSISSMFHHSHTITRRHTWLLPLHELKDPVTAAIRSAPHKMLGMTASSSYFWLVRWSFKSLTAAWGIKPGIYLLAVICDCLHWILQHQATRKDKSFQQMPFRMYTRQFLLHIRVSSCADSFILAGNQPVYNTKHSISLPAEGTVLALPSWDMTCHCHAITSGLKPAICNHCPWQHVVKVSVRTFNYVILCCSMFLSLKLFHILYDVTHKTDYEHLQSRCF